MNISIIGIGKLGLCMALNLANKGFQVLGADLNETYVQELNDKTFDSSEPGVNALLKSNQNFKATTNFSDTINFSDIIFIMVATPSLPNGKYDHSQIENVLRQIENIGYSNRKKTLIIGCTTFPGYCEIIFDKMIKLNYSIAYNPEFIAQGDILFGQLNPDLVLIGQKDLEDSEKISKIYNILCDNKPVVQVMSLTEAELTKLAINCFITTKISFANMIGDLCNNLKINHEIVLNTIGCDSRIGNKYLKWGFGFGGPCFPRDNRALGALCEENNIIPEIPNASDKYNNLHAEYQTNYIFKNKLINNTIKMYGASYKKGSNSIEESQQLKVSKKLAELGANVIICDTKEVIEKVKNTYPEKFEYEEL